MTNTTDRLSLPDSQKIANVVEQAFQACKDDSVSPDYEIAKAASEAKLTVEQTKRACEAFNVTRTLSHLKSVSGEDRANTFPIADTDKVLAIMFPEGLPEKCPEEDLEKEAFHGDEYDLGEYDAEVKGETLKSASQLHPVTFEMVHRKLATVRQKASVTRNDIRDQYEDVMADIERRFHKLASMTEGLYGPSVAGIKDDTLREAVGTMVTKAASERPEAGSTEVDVCVEETKALMKLASLLEDAKDQIEEDLSDFEKKAEVGLREMSTLGPEAYRPLMGLPVTDPVVGAMTRGIVSKNMDKIHKNFDYNPYSDPNLRDVVKTRDMLRTAVTLSRLMKDDPVLSKADPEAVTEAFNSVFSAMPGYFENPELARAALRHHVEYGGMDFPTMIQAMQGLQKLQDTTPTGEQRLAQLSTDYQTKAKDNKSKFQESIVKARGDDSARRDKMLERREQAKSRKKDDAASADKSRAEADSQKAETERNRAYRGTVADKAGLLGKGLPIDFENPGVQKALDEIAAGRIKDTYNDNKAKGII